MYDSEFSRRQLKSSWAVYDGTAAKIKVKRKCNICRQPFEAENGNRTLCERCRERKGAK